MAVRALEPVTFEETGRILCAALDDDAGVSVQAIGLLAKYLQHRVDATSWRVALEDVSGLDEDQEAIAELIDAGMLAVVLLRTDTDHELVVLPTDQHAADAAPAEDAIAYLNGFYDVENHHRGHHRRHRAGRRRGEGEPVMDALDEYLTVWQDYSSRSTWQDVRARARAAGAERNAGVAERVIADLPDVGPLDALQANRGAVELLVGRRWYVIREAREAGHSWAEIGAVLGTTAEETQDWYRDKIARQAEHLGDLHDAERAQRAL